MTNEEQLIEALKETIDTINENFRRIQEEHNALAEYLEEYINITNKRFEELKKSIS